ncbi:MAG TPA: HAD-IIIA family hydrolase [Terriglobia bacterium]|nr:HAD-IIIA family hydrolase [Terriglobia bacterium]
MVSPSRSTHQRGAVFLDRDGVLNRAPIKDGRPSAPHRLEELEILPGVEAACARLKDAGLPLFCVTNQPDVARGIADRKTIEAMNIWLADKLGLAEVAVCWHDGGDGCHCRKPLPGLLVDLANSHDLSLPQSIMIGDRWRDIEAGEHAGCTTIFIDYGYAEKRPARPDITATSLWDVVPAILQHFKIGD